MRLQVHIVTSGRLAQFKLCCLSVAKALPQAGLVTVIVNGAHEETEKWLKDWNHPAFHWESVAEEPRTVARNRAWDRLYGDIIYFLDDDVTVPETLFRDALKRFEELPNLAVLGGPNLTPPGSPWMEKVVGAVMTSSFAAPMVRARYGMKTGDVSEATEYDLILCNLAFRRSLIPRSLRFAEHLKSNEENLLLHQCMQLNLATQFSASLPVYHSRRSTLSGFLKQIFSYGYGRAQQTCAAVSSCHWAFLVPALVWLFLIALPFSAPLRDLFPFLVGLHLALSAYGAITSKEVRTLGFPGALATIPLTGMVHLTYGLGFWAGLFR